MLATPPSGAAAATEISADTASAWYIMVEAIVSLIRTTTTRGVIVPLSRILPVLFCYYARVGPQAARTAAAK
jgi:hypothetical protein